MVQEADRTGNPVYKSLARFSNLTFLSHFTETFGDIPYSETVKMVFLSKI